MFFLACRIHNFYALLLIYVFRCAFFPSMSLCFPCICLPVCFLSFMYTLNSEPKALTGDKSEGIKSRGAAEAFIRGFSPVKAEGEEFNVLILSYTRELSRPFKENKG